MLLGIMAAMPEEINKIIAEIADKEIVESGSRIYYKGNLYGQPVVVAFSRWGKVAAATTATTMILQFGVEKIIFTGVAGAVSAELNVGDIVIGERLFQHDMDARPLVRRYEIPLTGKTSFETSEQLIRQMSIAVNRFLKNNTDFRKLLVDNGIEKPKMLVGDIASADLFVSRPETRQSINHNLPSVICVEMEGAAVAQVCDDYGVSLTVVRIISDLADGAAHISAISFLKKHAADFSLLILKEYLSEL